VRVIFAPSGYLFTLLIPVGVRGGNGGRVVPHRRFAAVHNDKGLIGEWVVDQLVGRIGYEGCIFWYQICDLLD
jgi:hypothetical protein